MYLAQVKSDHFNKLMNATKKFISDQNNNRIMYTYVQLSFSAQNSTVTAVAVDGYRMSVEHAVCFCEEDFTVYVKPNVKLPCGKEAVIEMHKDEHKSHNECLIRCGDFIFGYPQPVGEFLNWKGVLPKGDPVYRIGFDGDFLISALQAAKVSLGSFKSPVVLEFRAPDQPILLRTNKEDIKMVLPIRISEEVDP